MLATVYLALSTALLFFVFVIWSKRGILNLTIKMVFLGSALLGAFELLRDLGFVVQV
jgi:hypothetical protein